MMHISHLARDLAQGKQYPCEKLLLVLFPQLEQDISPIKVSFTGFPMSEFISITSLPMGKE
jgi:hypothetical protein